MKRVVLVIAVAGLSCLVGLGSALAYDTLTLTNVSGGVAYGVYTSPYEITVNNGVSSNLTTLFCDDVGTDISIGDKWYANVTSGSAVSTTAGLDGLKFGLANNNPEGQALQAYQYAQMFYLVQQSQNFSPTSSQAEAISWAIWDTALPTQAADWVNAHSGNATSFFNTADISNTQAGYWLNLAGQITAQNYTQKVDMADFTVYTPEYVAGSQGYIYPSQEFIGVVPEPASLLFLGMSLCGLGLASWRKAKSKGL